MRFIYPIIYLFLTVFILWININLHAPRLNKKEKTEDIILQLNFIEDELKNNNLGKNMQALFPEGFVFVNALYGMSWCELAINSLETKENKTRAIIEALYAYHEINKKSATWKFDEKLQPKFGVFYAGWKNYLLSKILSVNLDFNQRKELEIKFHNNCEEIKNAILSSNSPFLESYQKNSWPADMSLAMASLAIHDKIYSPKYNFVISNWISQIKQIRDKNTGLLPYKVDSELGFGIQAPRGSGTTLYLRMLAEINPEFGASQYWFFKKHFMEKTFGLPSIREYPKATNGLGDIDSGPVLFGVGFSATIVSVGTIPFYENSQYSSNLYKTINAFGFPITTNNKKKYIFGQLAMADAFIAWTRASTIHIPIYQQEKESTNWQLKFHVISFSILLILWAYYFRKKIKTALIKK